MSREAARALGNLSANLEHGDSILKEGALKIFMALIRSEDHPVQRMAAMALCNLSSNVCGSKYDVLKPYDPYSPCPDLFPLGGQ